MEDSRAWVIDDRGKWTYRNCGICIRVLRKEMIGWETRKVIIISELVYGCGALACYRYECDDLEVMQNGFGRCLWEVGKVRNELVR